MDAMWIDNNRDDSDNVHLYSSCWSGILVGTDGYPKKGERNHYFIAGGDKNGDFKATAIEFYGVKTEM